MKAYTFIHNYICGIQVGIQASHSIVELVSSDQKHQDLVRDWTLSHRTMAWLDGGDFSSMMGLADTCRNADVPYAVFQEDAMNGLVTSISFVLSTEMVEIADSIRHLSLAMTYECFNCIFVDHDGDIFHTVSKGTGELLWAVSQARSKTL